MRMACVVMALACCSPAIGLCGTEGFRGEEWERHSVVYGEIVSATVAGGIADVSLQVYATLAGTFDAAAMPTVTSRFHFGGYCAVLRPPTAKSKVVALLERRKGIERIAGVRASFMPDSEPIAEVRDFSDPKVAEMLDRLRLARTVATARANTPRHLTGKEPDFWRDRAIAFGKIGQTVRNQRKGTDETRSYSTTIEFEVQAILAGSFDPALDSRVAVTIRHGAQWTVTKDVPGLNARAVVVLERENGDRRFFIPNDYFLFMPGESPITVVSGLDDPKAKQIVKQVRELRK